MNIFEWIFGKNDNREYERIRVQFLSRTQEAVDIYHGQLDSICGNNAKKECGPCYFGEISKDEEFLYNKCINYQERCKLRSQLMLKCKQIEDEAAKELKTAFVECRCCLLRPWYRRHQFQLED